MKLVIYNTANSRTAEDRIGRRSIRFNSVKLQTYNDGIPDNIMLNKNIAY